MPRMLFWLMLLGLLLWLGVGLYDTTRQETLTREIKNNQDNIIALLTRLNTQATARPQAHTACDTEKILQDLRAHGIPLPHYEVENRCP